MTQIATIDLAIQEDRLQIAKNGFGTDDSQGPKPVQTASFATSATEKSSFSPRIASPEADRPNRGAIEANLLLLLHSQSRNSLSGV